MKKNIVIQTLMNRKSIRKFTEETPSDELIQTIIKAGQQAPFAFQIYSVLLSKNKEKNPWKAPLLFTICIDSYKFEKIMEERNWIPVINDLELLIFGIQDASYMAENMVIAGESLGIGSCFIGGALFQTDAISKKYNLPKRVFPLVQLVMGFSAENPPVRPRYPLGFTLFEDKYPNLPREKVRKAMQVMDQGYLEEGYYRAYRAKIPLRGEREEKFTYDNYSWTEHISRKLGQLIRPEYPNRAKLLHFLEKCGFKL